MIIVPDGILGLLPFEALVLKAGTGLKDSVFVGDRYTLSYYQSAAIMALKRSLKEAPGRAAPVCPGKSGVQPSGRPLAPGPPGTSPATGSAGSQPAAFRALAASQEWGKTTRDGKTGAGTGVSAPAGNRR